MEISQITPTNVKNFVQGNYNYYISRPPHIEEQANYRAFLCQDCHTSGRCSHCGCKTPQMFFSPSKVDALKKWGKMLDPTEWSVFKTTVEYAQFLASKFSINVKNDSLRGDIPGLLEGSPAPDSPVSGPLKEEGLVEDNVGANPTSAS